MDERKFDVIDNMGNKIASYMDFEMAIVFIKGYCNEFYMEQLELTIRECDRTKAGGKNE